MMRNWINLFETPSPRAQINAIAKKHGVAMDFEIEPDLINLYHIERPSTSKPGSGRAALEDLGKLADEYGMTIKLTAAEGHPDLIRYYTSIGYRNSVSHDKFSEYAAQWDEENEATWDESPMWRYPNA